MSLLLCMCKGRHVVIDSSYHICISFIFSPFPYNTTYSSWLATSYSSPSFTMLMWSYHWWSRYPFVLVPCQEWTYNNPWCILKYYRNYYFGEWNTDIIITRDNFRTLMDIVIIDSTCTNMLQWTLTITSHDVMMVS